MKNILILHGDKKVNIKLKDNSEIVGIWHFPNTKTNKVIILAHGITVDKDEGGFFVDLALLLVKNGFAVFRFDFRGHGESSGHSIDMTISNEIEDLDSVVNYVKQEGFNNIGLVGSSFGGGVSPLYAAGNKKIKALCLLNPCLNYDHCFLNPTLPWIKRRKGHMKNDLKAKGWTDLGSRKFKLGKKLFDEMAKLYPYKALKLITVPTVIIHGDKDTYVPYEDSKKYSDNIKSEHFFVTIKGAEHGFHDSKKDADKVNIETLRFFKKYL